MATSITMKQTTQQNKVLSRSITNVNPDANPAQISSFVKKLNALTTNILGSVDRIDKTEIDTDRTYYPLTFTYEFQSTGAGCWSQDPNDPNTFHANATTATMGDVVAFVFKVNGQQLPLTNQPFTWTVSTSSESAMFTAYTYKRNEFQLAIIAPDDYRNVENTTSIIIPDGKIIYNSTTYYYTGLTLNFHFAPQS